jgi:hypothetical protein
MCMSGKCGHCRKCGACRKKVAAALKSRVLKKRAKAKPAEESK